jgi:hypothetical protein
VAAGAEADELPRVGRVGPAVVVLSLELRRVDQQLRGGGFAGEGVRRHVGAPKGAWAPASIGAAGRREQPAASRQRLVDHLAGVVLLFLMVSCGGFCIVPAVIRGGKVEDAAAAAAHQREIQKATEELEQKKKALEDQNRSQQEVLAKLQRLEDQMRENHRDAMRGVSDQNQRAELQRKQDAERANFEQEKREMERDQQRKLAEAKAEAEKARQQQQTIISAPPPVYYYPPYHWRYYW